MSKNLLSWGGVPLKLGLARLSRPRSGQDKTALAWSATRHPPAVTGDLGAVMAGGRGADDVRRRETAARAQAQGGVAQVTSRDDSADGSAFGGSP
jgi:hypothetical protein